MHVKQNGELKQPGNGPEVDLEREQLQPGSKFIEIHERRCNGFLVDPGILKKKKDERPNYPHETARSAALAGLDLEQNLKTERKKREDTVDNQTATGAIPGLWKEERRRRAEQNLTNRAEAAQHARFMVLHAHAACPRRAVPLTDCLGREYLLPGGGQRVTR